MSIEEEIYSKLVEQFSIDEVCIKKWGTRKQLTWLEFINLALKYDAISLPNYCGFSHRDSFSVSMRTRFPFIVKSKHKREWKHFLLSIINKKLCYVCHTIKEYDYFNTNSSTPDELNSECIECRHNLHKPHLSSARAAKRRAMKLKATPKWADLKAIKEIYKNCPEGAHVDHWAPLQGELVCGLHCEANLQYLTAAENLAKSNKFEV